MKIRTDTRGMTLVELTVVTVLGSLILAAMFQVLISNQRTFAAQNAGVQSRQTLRGGMDVAFSELREISPEDGDVVEMEEQRLHIRAGRSVGLICSIISTSGTNHPIVQAKKVGRYLDDDSARVFYENDPSLRDDDVWRTANVEVMDTSGTLTCPDGSTAQEVQLNGVRYAAPTDSILTGALVRNFVHYRYELGDYNGRSYLLRIASDGASTPLVGPLDATDGVSFGYLDGDGAPTAVPEEVRQIEITLRTTSQASDARGEPFRDSLTTRIFTRNTSH